MGVYTKVMLAQYFWHIQAVFLSVLGVVTAINVSSEIVDVWADGAAGGTIAALTRTSEYVFLRLLDNGTQVFPVALVLGISWTEIAHAESGRKTIVRTAGISFTRASAALLIAVAASFPFQFLLDNIVRPYAFMSLSVKGLGEYGWSYQRHRAARTEWIPLDGDILQVRMEDDPDPLLGNATLYRFSADGTLSGIVEAPELTRKEHGGSEDWEFQDGRSWEFQDRGNPPPGQGGEKAVRLAGQGALDLPVPLSSLWLEYRDIAAKYVPLPDLFRLSQEAGIPDNAPRYGEWLHIRFAQAFNPGLIGLFVAVVFSVFLDRYGLFRAAVWMVVAGYACLTFTRVMAIVAEYHVLPVPFAVWMPPLLFLAGSALLFRLVRRRERRFELMTRQAR